jgi:hypothetical protein
VIENNYFNQEWIIIEELKSINRKLGRIEKLLTVPNSFKIVWISYNTKSLYEVKEVDTTLSLTQPYGNNIGVPVELNSDGSVYTFNPANIQWAIQDATIASFTVDPTTGFATFTPLAAGTTQVAVTDTQTGLEASANLTVTPPTVGPASISITWQAPVGVSTTTSAVKKA